MKPVGPLAIFVMSALGLMAAPAAAQTLYASEVAGAIIDQNGQVMHFDNISTRGSQVPTAESRVTTTFSGTTKAAATDGGTVGAELNMAPLDPLNPQTHAQSLTAVSSVGYILTLSSKSSSSTTQGGLVPVHVLATGGAVWDNNATATAEFTIRDARTEAVVIDDLLQKHSGVDSEGDNISFTVDQVFDLDPAKAYQIFMSATVGAFDTDIPSDGLHGVEAAASVDPTFTVVGAFASQWSLNGIPQDVATGGVPEPATWALLIVGMGLAGAGLRRGRAGAAGALDRAG